MGQSPKLEINGYWTDIESYAIGWDFGDGDGIDCHLGEVLRDAEDPTSNMEREGRAAELAMQRFAEGRDFERSGLLFENGQWSIHRPEEPYRGAWIMRLKDAKAALRVCKAAIAELRSKKAPLEDWERKALAAGWKPPKGRM